MVVGWDLAADVANWSGLPPLDGDVSADACVVGLGGSGLAAVESLVDRGLSVVAVDAGRVAAGAAGRNGGFLLGGPDAYLHSAIAAWGSDAAVWLYRETLRELDHLAELLPDVVHRVGSIRLAGLPGEPESLAEADDRAAEVRDCAEHEAALRAHGIAVERYAGDLGTGLFLPDDAAMNPARRALGLARRLSSGAALHERTTVRHVAPKQVVTDRGTVSADLVVVAVDGRLELLVPALAGRVRTARLQMVMTEPVEPGRLPCPVYGRWGYDYAQQDVSGRILCGGGRDLFEADEWTTDAEPTAQVQTYVADLAARMAGEEVGVTHRWAASVGFTIGSAGRALCTLVDDGVMAVGGYNGTGNLVGPVAARAAVAHLLDGVPIPSCFAS
ncbi:MAG: NAD(P)/FAD-dependent oxidoreductase [Jatrophihabitantaceae bacterium]